MFIWDDRWEILGDKVLILFIQTVKLEVRERLYSRISSVPGTENNEKLVSVVTVSVSVEWDWPQEYYRGQSGRCRSDREVCCTDRLARSLPGWWGLRQLSHSAPPVSPPPQTGIQVSGLQTDLTSSRAETAGTRRRTSSRTEIFSWTFLGISDIWSYQPGRCRQTDSSPLCSTIYTTELIGFFKTSHV